MTPSQAQIDESQAALGPGANPNGSALFIHSAFTGNTSVLILVTQMTPQLTYNIRFLDGVNEVVVENALTTGQYGNGLFLKQFKGVNISDYDVEFYVGATSSGEVWSQLPDDANPASPAANTSLDITERAVDNIEFLADQDISGIRWWGGWCGAGAPTIEEFRVRFYDSITAGGSTSNVIYEETVMPVSVTATGATLPCGAAEEVFEADLPLVFPASANTTYWVEVVGIFGDGGVFNITNASSASGMAEPDGDGDSLHWSFGFSQWLTDFPDRAFELLGETDSTEVRMYGVNPG
jgi:hypothetical protein